MKLSELFLDLPGDKNAAWVALDEKIGQEEFSITEDISDFYHRLLNRVTILNNFIKFNDMEFEMIWNSK